MRSFSLRLATRHNNKWASKCEKIWLCCMQKTMVQTSLHIQAFCSTPLLFTLWDVQWISTPRPNKKKTDLNMLGRVSTHFFFWNFFLCILKVRKRAKIRNRYYQAPHLTQDTNGKVKTSQLDITNESQEVSPFPAGNHKASINRRARKHNKNKTEIT